MTIKRPLDHWRQNLSMVASLVVWREIPPHLGMETSFPEDLHPSLAQGLRSQNIHALYSHQSDCLKLARQGKNIVVVTGTASGKTLCYNIPILDCLLKDEQSRALYLFPTKALTQDQAAALRSLLGYVDASKPLKSSIPYPTIYDGDTPTNAHQLIRSTSRILFSNPDMLHLGILPHHSLWMDFFSELKFVVIDEAHIYRGVFGSHVANVIRRLQRTARFYGSDPQFILTSATIANPEEFASRLIQSKVALVSEDGAAHGPKTFLVYNPPMIDPELGLRRSALQESVRLAQELLESGVQTIIFGRSRRTVELILSYLRQARNRYHPYSVLEANRGIETPTNLKDEMVRGYRSGYLPQTRREIEHGLRQGDVRAVVATNALELGIDIGGMGASLLVGYPGTIASTLQQAGRAGRGSEPALAILVVTADPIDQFLAAHPEYLFDRPPELALINPDNPLILLDHLRCAAFELPFQEEENFGNVDPSELKEYLTFLEDQGFLHHSREKYFWMADQYPAQSISLRSADSNPIILQLQEDEALETIGQVDRISAHWLAHPNAIYLHEGETFIVQSLDFENSCARLHRVATDYYTLPRRDTSIQLIELLASQEVRGGVKSKGDILVSSKVTGFKKIRWFTHELIGVEPLEMPPVEIMTTGYWFSLSDRLVAQLKGSGLWNNEPNDYGPNWIAQKNRARQRDGFRCQVCGAAEADRAHHVHHKTPFRMFMTFSQANALENLITLCPDCHRKVETIVRIRSGLAGLSSVIGNLAPLFLMCDITDLGVHADPQSPLSEGSPTVVVFDQISAGLGFSQRLYELHDELMGRALELVSACPCKDGCPSCVGPGGELGAGGKEETLAILQSL